jgi:hypothetical protein
MLCFIQQRPSALTLGLVQLAWMGFPSELSKVKNPPYSVAKPGWVFTLSDKPKQYMIEVQLQTLQKES